MAYWLLKTEPDDYSWNDQVKRGSKGEVWTGVRNFTARRHLKEMKKGDKFFFYHTGDEKQIVGIGEVIRESFPDPTAAKDEAWVAVTTVADKPLPKPVTLATIKAEAKLKDMTLVKYGRLSVQPVTDTEWKLVCKMGGHRRQRWASMVLKTFSPSGCQTQPKLYATCARGASRPGMPAARACAARRTSLAPLQTPFRFVSMAHPIIANEHGRRHGGEDGGYPGLPPLPARPPTARHPWVSVPRKRLPRGLPRTSRLLWCPRPVESESEGPAWALRAASISLRSILPLFAQFAVDFRASMAQARSARVSPLLPPQQTALDQLPPD